MAFIPMKAYAKADLLASLLQQSKTDARWTVQLPVDTSADTGAFALSRYLFRTKPPPAFCFHRKQQPSDRNTQRNYFTNEFWRIYHGRACSCMGTLWEGEKSTKWQLHGWWSLIFSGMLVQDGGVISTSSALCHTVPQLMSKPKKYVHKMVYDSFKA